MIDLDKKSGELEFAASQAMQERWKSIRLSEDERAFTVSFLGKSFEQLGFGGTGAAVNEDENTIKGPLPSYEQLSASLARMDPVVYL